ncbi:hypothetical protein C5167_008486, partial [Papaver somniferum]
GCGGDGGTGDGDLYTYGGGDDDEGGAEDDGILAGSDCVDGVEPNINPSVGMGFNNIDDAWEFYRTFGKETGFPVMKSTFKKNVAREIRSYTFTCPRADDMGQLKKGFWADGRCREEYKEFGEVISFDTAYLVNSKVADRAVKSEFAFNDIKQLEILKTLEVEPKSPATNECKEGEEKNSLEEEIVNNDMVNDIVNDTILNPIEIKRFGRPRSNTYKSTRKYSKKRIIASTDVNACNEQDEPVSVDVPAPKKRGRPPGSKNKNKEITNLNADRNVQVVPQQESTKISPPFHMYQPNEFVPQAPTYQANGVAPQVHMYQPLGIL